MCSHLSILRFHKVANLGAAGLDELIRREDPAIGDLQSALLDEVGLAALLQSAQAAFDAVFQIIQR